MKENKKTKVCHVKISSQGRLYLDSLAASLGFISLSSYTRTLLLSVSSVDRSKFVPPEKNDNSLTIVFSEDELKRINDKVVKFEFDNISSYIRYVLKFCKLTVGVEKTKEDLERETLEALGREELNRRSKERDEK
jgi:hypothetical protein